MQETERMVALLKTIKSSLAELDLGLKGILTMSDTMEKLMIALSTDTIPQNWTLAAYPSLRPLTSWITNLVARAAQLTEWTSDFTVPKSVWLPGILRIHNLPKIERQVRYCYANYACSHYRNIF